MASPLSSKTDVKSDAVWFPDPCVKLFCVEADFFLRGSVTAPCCESLCTPLARHRLLLPVCSHCFPVLRIWSFLIWCFLLKEKGTFMNTCHLNFVTAGLIPPPFLFSHSPLTFTFLGCFLIWEKKSLYLFINFFLNFRATSYSLNVLFFFLSFLVVLFKTVWLAGSSKLSCISLLMLKLPVCTTSPRTCSLLDVSMSFCLFTCSSRTYLWDTRCF